MSTRKAIIVVGIVLLTIGLLIVLFVGGIVGLAFYSIGKSEAATTAKNFLRNNDRLKEEIGEVKDFGRFITGNINVQNNDGNATLNLKVIGERDTVNATVEMLYKNGREWRITTASFKNKAGQTVNLLNAYDALLVYPLLVA
jgi:hypothetical protein